MSTALLLLAIVFFFFCSYMAVHAVLQFNLARTSTDWPATSGVLEAVSLWGTRNIGGQMVEAQRLTVAYDFSVNGVSYSNSNVAFYQLHYPETLEFANARPKGSVIEVYYNPSDPNKSVLIPGNHPSKPFGPIILALLGVFISAGVAVAAWLGLFT